jgi:DNA polymerase III delta prime subunit
MEDTMSKFQPILFSDFEIDADIIDVLNTLIKMDKINILLIGDIGSGKTSLLNSLIREYYKDISPKCYADNVLHINSLKDQGINYYRNDVKIFCQTGSLVKHKKKIIVLDNIDFINEQSQQVFRNCIDKFSHNVHFISSCGNIQKVVESLQSRFVIIKLKQVSHENMTRILYKIKETLTLSITDDAEQFILNVSRNSVKTLVNYMEKIKLLGENVDIDIANKLCTNISFLIFEEYSIFVKNKNLRSAIVVIYDIYDKGYSVMDILDNYFLFVKITNIFSELEKYNIIHYICKYITVFHNIHEDEIELSLFTNNLASMF